MAPMRPVHRSTLGALAVLVAVGLVLGGCTSPRNTLGTNSSPCLRALAVAKSAVRGSGTYAGVRYLPLANFLTAVSQVERNGAAIPAAVRKAKDPVCVVNYRGNFSAASVEQGWPPGRTHARFAVVAVDAKTNRLLGTLVLRRSPVRFSRLLV